MGDETRKKTQGQDEPVAGVSPGTTEDRKKKDETLEDKLASGFMAAYNDRVGNEG